MAMVRQNLSKRLQDFVKLSQVTITIKGESIIHKTTRQITEMSVGHILKDRHRDGMVLEMTVAENIALQTYYKEPNLRMVS